MLLKKQRKSLLQAQSHPQDPTPNQIQIPNQIERAEKKAKNKATVIGAEQEINARKAKEKGIGQRIRIKGTKRIEIGRRIEAEEKSQEIAEIKTGTKIGKRTRTKEEKANQETVKNADRNLKKRIGAEINLKTEKTIKERIRIPKKLRIKRPINRETSQRIIEISRRIEKKNQGTRTKTRKKIRGTNKSRGKRIRAKRRTKRRTKIDKEAIKTNTEIKRKTEKEKKTERKKIATEIKS